MTALIGTTAAGEGFDAGPAGAAVTPANTALSDVTGTGTALFAAGALDGAFCVRVVTTATQTKFLNAGHTPVPLAWYVWDVYLEGLPAATTYLASWVNGTVKVGDLRVDPAGVLTLRDVNRAVIVVPAAQALAAAGWYRFAVKAQPGSATGHALRVYAPPNALAGTTPVVNLTGSAVDSAEATVSGIRVGVLAASALAYRIDRLRGDDTAEPGAGTGGGGGGGTPPANDLLDEGFEGVGGVPADGTLVTPANTTLSDVTGSGTAEFDVTAIEGARSALITCVAQDKYLRKDFTPQPLGWFTFKLRLPAEAGTGTVSLASWLNGTVKIGDLRLDRATNVLTLRDFNTGVATATGAALVPGTDHRIAVRVQPGSATGHQLKVYLSEDSTTPSYNSGGQPCTAAGQGAVSAIRVGVVAAGTLTYRLDSLRGSSVAEPGISGGGGANADPVADAGADQRVIGETVVTLGGAGADSDGTIAAYTWRQVSGTAVTLSSLSTAQPTFTAPMVSADTTMVFGLRVTDDDGALSAEDTVSVTVAASLLYAARNGTWAPRPIRSARALQWDYDPTPAPGAGYGAAYGSNYGG